MNKRKVLKHTGPVRRLFGRQKNRRVLRKAESSSRSSSRVNSPSKSFAQRVEALKRLARLSVQAAGVLTVLTLLGWLGHWCFQEVQRSKYFHVSHLEVQGVGEERLNIYRTELESFAGQLIFKINSGEFAEAMRKKPWVKDVHLAKRFPRTLILSVEEYEPVAAVLMDSFYLVSEDGTLFKRAELEELTGLEIISGLSAKYYEENREQGQALLRQALKALALYKEGKERPKLSELSVNRDGSMKLFLYEGGTGFYFDEPLAKRHLDKVDALWANLGRGEHAKARAVYFDSKINDERIVVRMAAK